ncbi:MAG: WGR domain-containing protein [bacterium]
MKKNLICKEGTSNKFWNIECDDINIKVHYGSIGTNGTSSVKPGSIKDAEKLLNSKIKKGYVELDNSKETFTEECGVTFKEIITSLWDDVDDWYFTRGE